jgi:hypothetical protein
MVHAAWRIGLGILFCHFIFRVLLNLGISEFMRWRGWIKPGDQLLIEEGEKKVAVEEEEKAELGDEKAESGGAEQPIP